MHHRHHRHIDAAARLLDHLVEAMDVPFDFHKRPLNALEDLAKTCLSSLFSTFMSPERQESFDVAVQSERCNLSANKCAADLEQRPPGVRTSRDARTRSHRRQRASKKALIDRYTKDEKGTKLGLYRLFVVFQSGFSPREYLRVHVNAGRDKVYELLAGVGMAFAEFGSRCWRALPVAADRRLSCVAPSGDPFDALLLAPVGDNADPSTLLRTRVKDQAWHAKLMLGGVQVGDVFRVGSCSFKVTEVHDVRGKPDDDGVRVNVVFSGEETLSSLIGEMPARRPSWVTESVTALKDAGYRFEHGKAVLLGRLGVSMTLSYFSVYDGTPDVDDPRWKTVAASVRQDLGATIKHELVNVGEIDDGDGKPPPWQLHEGCVNLDGMPLSIPFEPRPGVNLSPRVQARIEELRAEGFKGDPVRKAESEEFGRALLVEVKEAHKEEYREQQANALRRREARHRGEPLDETDSDDDWDDYDDDDDDERDDHDESGSLVSSMALMAEAFEGTSLTESMPPPAPVADAPVAATPMEEDPRFANVLPMNPPSVRGLDPDI
jgi:hypothetical protein